MSRARLVTAVVAVLCPTLVLAQEVTVSAAASLTHAFREIGARFQAANPGVTLRYNFAASGVLLQQIRQGAPVDVFASADQETMDRAVAEKLVEAAARRDFAANALVLVVPARQPPAVASMADLTKPEVRRIAIGKLATVPAGRYAKEALDAAKLWAVLEPKFIQADSVRQVLDYVGRGEVEAGFVYRTDAAVMADRVKVVATATGHAPIRYPVAAVAESRQKAQARAFVEFLSSPAAREILRRAGFDLP